MKFGFVFVAVLIAMFFFLTGCVSPVISQGSGIPETNAKSAWKSAEPWAIIDWARTGDTLTIVLKNNSPKTLTFNSFTTSAGGSSDIGNGILVAPGGTINRNISGLGPCSKGEKYLIPKSSIRIEYDYNFSTGGVEEGAQDIVGTCN